MNLKGLLSEKKAAIVKKWFDLIIDNYPADASDFLKRQKNRFSNPVGHTILQGIDGLFDEILHGIDSEKLFPFLNDIIKIKAVQDFFPSKAISFVFLLKRAIREEMGSEIKKKQMSDELRLFEEQIDELALLSFDIYMKCRERIYEIKADEARRMMFRLLQRANLICDPEFNSGQEQESVPEAETVLTQKIKG